MQEDGGRHAVPCSDRAGASRLGGMRDLSPKYDDRQDLFSLTLPLKDASIRIYPLRSKEALVNPETGGFALDFQGL